MKKASSSPSGALKDSPLDLYTIFVNSQDSQAKTLLFGAALIIHRTMKNARVRPQQLELAYALIIGEALNQTRTCQGAKGLQELVTRYHLKPKDVHSFLRLAQNSELILSSSLHGVGIKDILHKLEMVEKEKAAEYNVFTEILLSPPVQNSNKPEPSPVAPTNYCREEDDDVVEEIRAIARNGGLF